MPEIQRITASDDMELGKLGERKQAIFCIIPDSNDASLNFLVGMLYTQAFQELYYQADKVHQGALPVPVRLMFDEFANVALPDGYARLQATMRSRNIMSTIILQNISQLKALFKDDWEGIIGNADSFLYLGGNEQSTHKYISRLLGKETIDTKTSSQSKGRNGSYSQNFQQTGRDMPYLFVKSSVALNLS
ncbi:MAG: type IV secretory system conjugative DNA transfer family protein [Roseburia inulinivorans]